MACPLAWRVSNCWWKMILQEDGSLQYNQPEKISAPHPPIVVWPIFWYVQKDPQTEFSEYATLVLIRRKSVMPCPLARRVSTWWFRMIWGGVALLDWGVRQKVFRFYRDCVQVLGWPLMSRFYIGVQVFYDIQVSYFFFYRSVVLL